MKKLTNKIKYKEIQVKKHEYKLKIHKIQIK